MKEERVRARRLQRRVEYFQLSTVSDGFGGSTVQEVKLREYWAEVESVGSNVTSVSDQAVLGVETFKTALKITVRAKVEWNEPRDYKIKFGGKEYEVVSVEEINKRRTRTIITVREYES